MAVVTKIYPDFDPGTYDTSKIFLQADAITGALEKVNLPVIPSSFSLSSITDAAADNTIANANFLQVWNWTGLNNQSAFTLGASAPWTGGGGTPSTLFDVQYTGTGYAGSKLYGAKFSALSSGSGLNTAAYFQALNGTTNVAIGLDSAGGLWMYRPSDPNTYSFRMRADSVAPNSTEFVTTNGDIIFKTKNPGGETLRLKNDGSVSLANPPLNLEIASGTGIGLELQVTGYGRYNLGLNSGYGYISMQNYGFYFYNANAGGKELQIFTTTGNVMIQKGGTYTDIASSRFSVNSTTQGMLPPRMSTAQKTAISSPENGLLLFDTDLQKLCVRTSGGWETITSS